MLCGVDRGELSSRRLCGTSMVIRIPKEGLRWKVLGSSGISVRYASSSRRGSSMSGICNSMLSIPPHKIMALISTPHAKLGRDRDVESEIGKSFRFDFKRLVSISNPYVCPLFHA